MPAATRCGSWGRSSRVYGESAWAGARAGNVHRAGDAGIEAVDGAQDLDRSRRVGEDVAGERRLVSPGLALGVTRAGVPGARHDRLVVGDLAVLDHDPVSERAARRLHEARTPRAARPGVR